MGGMGLGGARREWADYEWFSLAAYRTDQGRAGTADSANGLVNWLETHPVWAARQGRRLLLVDLDNLRADPRRWKARMGFVLALARDADDVVLAGQVGAVRRARPHLGELADSVRSVADGSDLADHVLLDAADALAAGKVQIAVLSNDGIFSSLAERGRLVVISPGADALSDRLAHAADLLVDLAALEAGGAAAVVPAPRAAPEPAAEKTVTTKAATKKAATKKAATKKTATKKTATKKTASKKTATKKTATKKTATKKTATKKAATKKAATKKAATKKAATKKAAAKTPPTKRSSARKTAAG
jgi:hypothetical protein